MPQPQVLITQLDGQLGVQPPSGRMLAIVGPCSTGPLNAPAAMSRVPDIIATYGYGPLVEAASVAVERFGITPLLTRCSATTAGVNGTVAKTGSGTSVITASGAPLDDFDIYVIFPTGGTVGTAGIAYQWSVDQGRTLSPLTALGTGNTITIPNSGVTLNLGVGTIVANDVVQVRTTAPAANGTDLGTALDALANTRQLWEACTFATPIDATIAAVIDGKFTSMATKGKYRWWIGGARVPTAAETEATYKTALDGIFSTYVTTWGALCAGAAKITSSVSGRSYRRSIVHLVAPFAASVSEEVNIAMIDAPGGPVPGARIRDTNGNPDEHDETVNPGLDDSKFITFKTHEGVDGIYITRPRLFSDPTSDFQLIPHRRVMNVALSALRVYFLHRLNKPVRVSKKTGYILEEEAQEIEKGANAVLRAVLLQKPKASAVSVVLSRTDNILSTKTLTVDARIVPLAYPEFINVSVGFNNPALQISAS